MALKLDVPVLALSQLSRQVENREDKRPVLSDLRESGQLEQDADTVIFCYRDEYYLERMAGTATGEESQERIAAALSRSRNSMDLIVAKQRAGPIGTVTVGFNAATNNIWV